MSKVPESTELLVRVVALDEIGAPPALDKT